MCGGAASITAFSIISIPEYQIPTDILRGKDGPSNWSVIFTTVGVNYCFCHRDHHPMFPQEWHATTHNFCCKAVTFFPRAKAPNITSETLNLPSSGRPGSRCFHPYPSNLHLKPRNLMKDIYTDRKFNFIQSECKENTFMLLLTPAYDRAAA